MPIPHSTPILKTKETINFQGIYRRKHHIFFDYSVISLSLRSVLRSWCSGMSSKSLIKTCEGVQYLIATVCRPATLLNSNFSTGICQGSESEIQLATLKDSYFQKCLFVSKKYLLALKTFALIFKQVTDLHA